MTTVHYSIYQRSGVENFITLLPILFHERYFINFFFYPQNRISLYSPGWTGTPCVEQAGLELTVIFQHLPPKCWYYRPLFCFLLARINCRKGFHLEISKHAYNELQSSSLLISFSISILPHFHVSHASFSLLVYVSLVSLSFQVP